MAWIRYVDSDKAGDSLTRGLSHRKSLATAATSLPPELMPCYGLDAESLTWVNFQECGSSAHRTKYLGDLQTHIFGWRR